MTYFLLNSRIVSYYYRTGNLNPTLQKLIKLAFTKPAKLDKFLGIIDWNGKTNAYI